MCEVREEKDRAEDRRFKVECEGASLPVLVLQGAVIQVAGRRKGSDQTSQETREDFGAGAVHCSHE